jgi:Phage integrase family
MIRSRTLPSTLHSTVALVSGVNQEYSALDGCCYGCEAWWRGSPGRSLSTKVCSADLLAARQRRILHHPGRVPRRLAPRRHGGVQRTHRGSFQRLRQRPKLRSDGQRHCAILPTKGYEIRDRPRIHVGRGPRRGGQEADVSWTKMMVGHLLRSGRARETRKYLAVAPQISVRHSTAVALLKSGVDLSTISHMLGHASPTTTNRYAKVDLEMKRQAIAKVKPVARRPRRSGEKTRLARISILRQ